MTVLKCRTKATSSLSDSGIWNVYCGCKSRIENRTVEFSFSNRDICQKIFDGGLFSGQIARVGTRIAVGGRRARLVKCFLRKF